MPLRTTDNLQASQLDEISEEFLVFYSSITDGQLWCPDCRDIDPIVQSTFDANGPSALIVYVGQKSEWKRPAENIYRTEPWNITGVPTILKLEKITQGKITDRLEGENDAIIKKLAALKK
ncbi:hypothetical protein HWV62_39485 [Athelia sp. TMB]|nr:hypothetical protein HWV62_39485 [Athelia sp. TMB]